MKMLFKNWAWIFAILFLIVDLVLIVQRKQFEKQISYLYEQIESSGNNILIKNNMFLQMESEGMQISDTIKVEIEGERIELTSLLGDSPKIIFRYSELSCSSCIDNEIENIKKVIEEVGEENVLVFASYKNSRNLQIFKNIHKYDYKIYNLPESSISLPIENTGRPYLFVLDKSLVVRHAFIPVKEIPEYSKDFFSFVKYRYY